MVEAALAGGRRADNYTTAATTLSIGILHKKEGFLPSFIQLQPSHPIYIYPPQDAKLKNHCV